MKRFLITIISIIILAALISGCTGRSETGTGGNGALESAVSGPAEVQSEAKSPEEMLAQKAVQPEPAVHYTPTDDERTLICGDWYRSIDNGSGDKDIYWITMDDKGYCSFAHETMDSDNYIDRLDGTWDVDDHGFVNIDLGKYAGKFRFLKNSYGSTNIICLDGDDFVESGEDGAYAAFVPVKWYRGKLRFADTSTASETSAVSGDKGIIHVELQGEGDAWFPLAAAEGICKIDVDSRDGEMLCRLALNQNDHLAVKIQEIKEEKE